VSEACLSRELRVEGREFPLPPRAALPRPNPIAPLSADRFTGINGSIRVTALVASAGFQAQKKVRSGYQETQGFSHKRGSSRQRQTKPPPHSGIKNASTQAIARQVAAKGNKPSHHRTDGSRRSGLQTNVGRSWGLG